MELVGPVRVESFSMLTDMVLLMEMESGSPLVAVPSAQLRRAPMGLYGVVVIIVFFLVQDAASPSKTR